MGPRRLRFIKPLGCKAFFFLTQIHLSSNDMNIWKPSCISGSFHERLEASMQRLHTHPSPWSPYHPFPQERAPSCEARVVSPILLLWLSPAQLWGVSFQTLPYHHVCLLSVGGFHIPSPPSWPNLLSAEGSGASGNPPLNQPLLPQGLCPCCSGRDQHPSCSYHTSLLGGCPDPAPMAPFYHPMPSERGSLRLCPAPTHSVHQLC